MQGDLRTRVWLRVRLAAACGALIFIAACATDQPLTKVTSWLAGPSDAKPTPPPVAAPPYAGPKKRLAVLRLENKVRTPLPDATWQIGDGLTEMLISELFKTERFTMVERAALSEIVKEQELGQTGLVQRETLARVGDLLGAQLLVVGAVTEFEAESSGGGQGIGTSKFAFSFSSSSAHVAVDIRLVDASTGQILKSFNAAGKAQNSGLALAGVVKGAQLGSDAFQKTPLGQATREAIAKAVSFISTEMESVVWTGRVVSVKGQDVYVNAGTNMNLKVGMALDAFIKGEELRDPGTGLSLGSRDALAGIVTITDVQDKFSVGTFVGNAGLKRGDILKLK